MRHWLSLGLALLPGLVAAAPETVPLYREIKDWVVGCDNTRFCTAVLANAADISSIAMQVQREPGANGALHLNLVASPGSSAELLLDGQLLIAPWRIRHDSEAFLQLDNDDARAALQQLRNGQRLVDDTPHLRRESSLQGLSAALLLIDSVQGRVGHPSALVRPGPGRDDAALPEPAAPPAPVFVAAFALNDAERAGIEAAVMAQAARADQLKNEYDVAPKLLLYPLDAQRALALLSYNCNDFNCEYGLYQVARSAPHGLSAPSFEAPLSPVVNAQLRDDLRFDANKGELLAVARDDYPGSCGAHALWRYDGERFRLLSLIRMDRCAGVAPYTWPVIWRTQGVASPWG